MAQIEIEQRIAELFAQAPFVRHLGIKLTHAAPGTCEASLMLAPALLQQDGFGHAGVVATLADHCAGGAALTVADPDARVLSIEFKINLLRPAQGVGLRCRSTVLRAGRTVTVAESEVFALSANDADPQKLIAKATVTLAIVHRTAPE